MSLAAWEPIGDFRSIEGVRMHYVCSGEGAPVVMLHGNPGFLQDFSATVFPRLSGYRLCAVDRPGHGLSSRPLATTVTAEHQARLVHGLCAELGLRRPIIVGHSWSGALALACALKYSDWVSGLVLLGAMTLPVDPPSRFKDRLLGMPVLGRGLSVIASPLSRASRSVEENLNLAYRPDAPIPGHLKAAVRLWNRPSQIAATSQDNRSVKRSLRCLSPMYSHLSMPVTVIFGEDDPFVDPDVHVERFAQSVPHAVVIALKDTGHEIAHVHPEVVVTAINRIGEQRERRHDRD